MKKKFVTIFLFLFLLCGCGEKKNDGVKMQIIEYDNATQEEKVVDEYSIKKDDVIKLDKYSGNDITILEINDDDVKISREYVHYEPLNTLDEEGRPKYVSGTVKREDNIPYDKLIAVDINERDPYGPQYEMPRYVYNVKFVK